MDPKRTRRYILHLDPVQLASLMDAHETDNAEVLLQRLMAFEAHRLRFQPRPRRGTVRSVDQR